MKKSNVFLIAVALFAMGFISGLLFASYKGPPPMPGVQPSASPQSTPEATEEFNSKLAVLEKNLQTNPRDLSTLVKAGNLYFDHDKYEQAIEYYQKALDTGGENADILTDAGICYRRMGKPEKAVEYFRRARKADPTHQNSALNLGIVLFHDLQDRDAALAAWREYLALNPQGERADMIRRVVKQLTKEKNAENPIKTGQ